MKKEQVEQWIIEGVKSGKFNQNSPLPNVETICKKFSTSNMTVHGVLKKLQNLGILYSKRGIGFVPSPFFQSSLLVESRYRLKSNKEKIYKTSLEIPGIFVRRFFGDSKAEELKDWIGYLQLYFIKENNAAIAYNVSWFDPKFYQNDTKLNAKFSDEVKTIKERIFNDTSNRAEIISVENINPNDRVILDLEKNATHIPTNYFAYMDSKGEILQVRIEKIKANYYIHSSISTRIVNFDD